MKPTETPDLLAVAQQVIRDEPNPRKVPAAMIRHMANVPGECQQLWKQLAGLLEARKGQN